MAGLARHFILRSATNLGSRLRGNDVLALLTSNVVARQETVIPAQAGTQVPLHTTTTKKAAAATFGVNTSRNYL